MHYISIKIVFLLIYSYTTYDIQTVVYYFSIIIYIVRFS